LKSEKRSLANARCTARRPHVHFSEKRPQGRKRRIKRSGTTAGIVEGVA
jgi:hypothetical protein